MRRMILSMELLSVIYLVVLCYSMIFECRLKTKKAKIFLSIAAFSFLSFISDILIYVLAIRLEFITFLAIVSVFSMTISDAVIILFGFYIIETIKEKKDIRYTVGLVSFLFAGIDFIFLIVASFVGLIHYNGIQLLINPILYNIHLAILGLSILYYLGTIVYYRRVLGAHDCIAMLSYFITPSIFGIVEMVNSECTITALSIPISLLIVYIMLQSKEIDKAHVREEILNEVSCTDTLTKLPNRRAYEMALEGKTNESIGVVFLDMNGLKETNDTKGHRAGDELIILFSNMLREYFDEKNIYRISGDEFVVFVPVISKDLFMGMVEDFKDSLDEKKPICSFGTSYGEKSRVLDMVVEAEKGMYIDKNTYYETIGNSRRRYFK